MSIISTKYLLQDAQANGYAVPAFNIHNAETIQAILEVCSEMRSPVILAGTPGTFKHIALEEIYALCSAYSTTYNMPLALHLDHHESLDDIRRKVHAGVRRRLYEVHDEWSRKAINGDGRRNRWTCIPGTGGCAPSNGSGLASSLAGDCRPYGSGLSAKTWHRN